MEEGEFVAHTGTDVYGPGKVIGVEGDRRRVRFLHFVATIRAADLREASQAETEVIAHWLEMKKQRYGGQW
ncbi:hypothetical protein ACGFMM_04265 [Streptomyces sp. NPDC048604]|uniref:hypothetical protein n=1 Tax=Streptomyces sp. NPDC048604 TaxID=3365578 RepID=UPI00371D5845